MYLEPEIAPPALQVEPLTEWHIWTQCDLIFGQFASRCQDFWDRWLSHNSKGGDGPNWIISLIPCLICLFIPTLKSPQGRTLAWALPGGPEGGGDMVPDLWKHTDCEDRLKECSDSFQSVEMNSMNWDWVRVRWEYWSHMEIWTGFWEEERAAWCLVQRHPGAVLSLSLLECEGQVFQVYHALSRWAPWSSVKFRVNVYKNYTLIPALPPTRAV